LANGVSTLVEHASVYSKVGCSCPVTNAGTGREKKLQNILIYFSKFDKNDITQKPRKDIRKRFDLRDKPRSPVNTQGAQIITLQAEWTST
jgi:hypothetical protein